MRGFIFILFNCCLINFSFSQDTVQLKTLSDITIVGKNSKSDYQQMPEIVGTNIYAGKKSSLIVMDNVQGNVVMNTMRQVLAKVPGIHIWESDPSGIQIGIAARGLSPNRSWEFNIRQNGYDISADPYGYPEAYYNPQLQAVQRIEIVRGHGALQYGPQFGGMVNYILRNGSHITKKIEFETQQTVGSNGLFNSYNAIGGKKGKFHYYAFYDHRNGDGWRANSRFFTNAGFGTVTYNFSKKASLTAEIMHSHNRSQQPGGMTDIQFSEDPSASFRNRNWFDVKWTTMALIFNHQFNEHTRWNTKLFGTIGDRGSVGFMQPINVADSINKLTNLYNNRTVQIDQYRNLGIERRLITNYGLANMKNTFSSGIRWFNGNTSRFADGKGTTGSGYDISVLGQFPRDIDFSSSNLAMFSENIFRVTDRFLIIPGLRYEWVRGRAGGINGFTSNGSPILLQNIKKSRTFLLAGIGFEYHLTKATEFYLNYSEAYRPIQFANLQAAPTVDIIDENLRDSKGYNADLGYRGKFKDIIQFDVSAFYLYYGDRVGVISQSGGKRLITNLGASSSKGIESYVEVNLARALRKNIKSDLIVFSSTSYTDARYGGGYKDANLVGKKVENAPAYILRNGLTAGYGRFNYTIQLSYVSKAYSDASNTVIRTLNGQNGLIPAYTVTDISSTYKFNKKMNVKAGVNNLFNEMYFTRRSGGYPGPGLLPADGRTFFISFSLKF
jgi:Fe(3+) dicitrate transport protein